MKITFDPSYPEETAEAVAQQCALLACLFASQGAHGVALNQPALAGLTAQFRAMGDAMEHVEGWMRRPVRKAA